MSSQIQGTQIMRSGRT